MSNILISLISEQPIPNVLFIKERQDEVDNFYFLTTEEMERRDILINILNVCKIEENKIKKIIIPKYEIDEIQKILQSEFNNIPNKFIVNITGGTKTMSLEVYSFFKERRFGNILSSNCKK
ncbi:MAG: hypothetical protein ACP5QT_03050 [Brevinematia bacterium]